jgi:hypothetical protein
MTVDKEADALYIRRSPVTIMSVLRLPQRGTDQPLAPIEHGRFGAILSSHLGGRRSKIVLKAPKSCIRPMPEPLGIDVYRRCDHPIDLA